MAKKNAKESLRDASVQELYARLREIQERRFRLQFQHASNPLKNPMQIRQARRELAQIMTALRQKEKVA